MRSASPNPVSSAMSSTCRGWLSSRLRAASSRSRSTALAGVKPTSATKARRKLRSAMPAWLASSGTVRGRRRFSRIQASSESNRPPACISSRAENCDWPPGLR